MARNNDADGTGCFVVVALVLIVSLVNVFQDHPLSLMTLMLVIALYISFWWSRGKKERQDDARRKQDEERARAELQRINSQMLAREEQRRKEALAATLKRASLMSEISAMSGVEFEAFVAEFLETQGYSIQNTKASGDQGVDSLYSRRTRNRNHQPLVGVTAHLV